MRKLFFITLFVAFPIIIMAQSDKIKAHYLQPESAVNYPRQTHYLINESRKPMYLPQIDGYILLKADLHMHTIFSDGSIWPTTRVEEAFREGLDVISITDHLEFHYINEDKVNSKDLNMEYNIAKGLARDLGIILIPGAEVTREVPAGHYNLLFLDDANKLSRFINPDNPRDTLTLIETLEAARDLGCFITWNHPAYRNPRGVAEWATIHQKIYELGLMNGIEIINSNMYIPLVQKWAMDKNITMLSNSDAHTSIRIREGQHRPVTIILAKDRSTESVKEALFAGRTIGFSCNYLYGKREYTEPIFLNSVLSRILSENDKNFLIELHNISGIPYELEFLDNEEFSPAATNKEIVIYPNETLAIRFVKKMPGRASVNIKVRVNNIHINAAEPLLTTLK